MTAQPTIPTLVRYLGEFVGDDISIILKNISVPTLAIVPGFDEEYKSNKNYEKYFYWFNEIWQNFVSDNELRHIEIREVLNSRIVIFNDQPVFFDNTLELFLKD